MAQQVSHDPGQSLGQIASQADKVTGSGLVNTIISILQAGVEKLFNWANTLLNKWFPPEKREELKSKFMKLVNDWPRLAAFLVSQLVLSGLPLALFLTLAINVSIFALLVGITLGLLGAALFTVFCLGLALFILLPILCITTFAATFIFLFGLGAYYIVKWFNQKDVQGIPTEFLEGMKKQTEIDSQSLMLNGGRQETLGATKEEQNSDQEKQQPQQRQSHHNGIMKEEESSSGDAAAGEEENPPELKFASAPRKLSDSNASKGTDSSHANSTDRVKKTANGTISATTATVKA